MLLAVFLYSTLLSVCLVYCYYDSRIVEVRSVSILGGRSILQMYPVIIFTVIVGFRYQVGGDFEGYEGYFNNQSDISDSSQVPYEVGFFLLIELLHFINLPAQSLFVITAFIQALLLIKIIRASRECGALIILFYFLSLAFIESLNTLRQSIALLGVVMAVFHFREKNLKTFLIFALLSIAFHLSALIAIPIIILFSFINFHKLRFLILIMILVTSFNADVIVEYVFTILPMAGGGDLVVKYLSVRDDLLFEAPKPGGVGLYISIFTDLYLIFRGRELINNAKYSFPKYFFGAFVFGAILTPVAIESNFITFSRALMYFYGLKFIILGSSLYLGYKSGNKLVERSGIILIGISLIYFVWFYSAILSGAAHSAPYYFYGIT